MRRKKSSPKSAAVASIAPALTDEDINDVVQQINTMHEKAGLQLALEVGKLVIERFYDGDMELIGSRDPTKHVSYRKLAGHPELGISASQLSRSVAVTELCSRVTVATWQQLGVSHLRAVLVLPQAQQERLLERAVEKKWNFKKLAAEVNKIRGKIGGSRGRPALPLFVKSIHALEKYIGKDADPFADLSADKLSQLDGKEATKLYQTVTALKLKCEDLQNRLKDAVPGFGGAIDVEGGVEEPPKKKAKGRKQTKKAGAKRKPKPTPKKTKPAKKKSPKKKLPKRSKAVAGRAKQIPAKAKSKRKAAAKSPAKTKKPASKKKAPAKKTTKAKPKAKKPKKSTTSVVPVSTRILRALKGVGEPMNKTEILKATSVKDGQWSDAIKELLEEGKVTKEGRGRATKYEPA